MPRGGVLAGDRPDDLQLGPGMQPPIYSPKDLKWKLNRAMSSSKQYLSGKYHIYI